MDFNNRCAYRNPLDLHKRVLYSHGLVLGVGELKTEQDFMLGHHRGHNRHLHGYGTGAGLRLEIRYLPDGPECVVHPGWGVDPQGHDICVPEAQCAKLNQWLLQQQQAGDLSSLFDTSGTVNVEVYVVLCYRECETDKVPIPVGPCLSLDKAMVPSRIQESFELRLLSEPPDQAEEDAIRRFGDVLSRISIATGPGGLTTPEPVVDEIRAISGAEPVTDSIPSIPLDLALDPAYAEEIVRTALRVFVTEVRPALVPDGGPCLDGPRRDACLLLGRLIFDASVGLAGPQVIPDSVVIDESRRPLLLSTRLLQEEVLSNLLPGAAGNSPVGPLVTFTGALAGSPVGLRLPSVASSGTRLLTLRPGDAGSTGTASPAVFANAIPSLRFRRDNNALFAFSVPAELSATAGIRLRLQWAFSRPDGTPAVPITWEASLQLNDADADLTAAPAAAPQASIASAMPAGANGRLMSSDFVDLPRGSAVAPVVGFLNLALRSAADLPPDQEVHLILAELEFTTGAVS